jgi:hypothetical protein
MTSSLCAMSYSNLGGFSCSECGSLYQIQSRPKELAAIAGQAVVFSEEETPDWSAA